MNPKRTDGAKTVSFQLAADVRELVTLLAAHLSVKEGRRVPEREVIELAVRKLAKHSKAKGLV